MSKIGATRKKQEVDLKTNSLTTDINVSMDGEQIDLQTKNIWTMVDSQNNTAITLTKTGESGKSHYILGIIAAFGDSAINLVTIKDSSTIVGYTLANRNNSNASLHGLKITAGNDAVILLPASGTSGISSYITVIGYTE